MAKSNDQPWFTVDKEGLGHLRENADPATLIYELAQNAWDEDGTTEVRITLTPDKRGYARLQAVDDSPNGFADLTHAYTLFAPSYKKALAEKRGRFNVGEKLVLALAKTASIITTTGAVHFREDGTRDQTNEHTDRGTRFDALVRLTADQQRIALAGARRMIPPPGKATYINGEALLGRRPRMTITAKALPTVIENSDGSGFGATARNAKIEVYEPAADEVPMIYEMGIPVVETGDRWHANVLQKVPLNLDRDNVTPAYLRRIRQELLESMTVYVTGDEAAKVWVREGMAATSDPQVVQHVLRERFGEKAVINDPSDPEGTKRAVSEGYTVVYSRSLAPAEWAAVDRVAAITGEAPILPAGRVTPSNSTIELSADGKPPIPQDQWTPGMWRVAKYAEHVSKALLGFEVTVLITNQPLGGYRAAYGNRTLRLNVGSLGHRWFSEPDESEVLRQLIHEFSHETQADHLSHDYHYAGFMLGARGIVLAKAGQMPTL